MRRFNGRIPALLCGLLLAACTGVQETDRPASAAVPEILAADLRADVATLADDEMQGRATGTEGERRAADTIEGRYREIGLEPVDGSYRQPVELVGMQRRETSRIEITGPDGTLELRPEENFTYWSTLQQERVEIDDAELVFVGYGVQAPEHEWDDFKDTDVSGKVLLFLNDDPPVTDDGEALFGGEARTYYGRWTYKFEQAARHGAAGALVVHTTPSASYPFSVIQNTGAGEHFVADLPDVGYQVPMVGWLDSELSARIAGSLDTTLDGLFEMAADRGFEPRATGHTVSAEIETDIRRLQTENVMGMLPGSDPELSEQVVVFTAHYDHMGVNEDLTGDQIYNGAWDNAAGTAAIIHLADAFTSLPEAPRRSLLFLACAAEESGSLGSAWFVANPPFARSRLVANFNVDMPQIFGITTDIAAIGVDTNTLGDTLREVASEWPVRLPDGSTTTVTVEGDPNPAAGSFYRSDQVNFAKAGIPALFLQPGDEYVEELPFDPVQYEEEHYHQVADEITEEWDLRGLARDMRILFETARRVADAEEMPRWRPGNEFEEEWRRLHDAADG